MAYAQHISARETPQSEPIFGKPQVPNSAGGFSFVVDDWARLDRFLILGAEGGTYYASERKLVRENAECVLRCLKLNGLRTVARIIEISLSGRAPKNDPAVFALAMCLSFGDAQAKGAAAAGLPKVARTGTHLFQFVDAASQLRGWGRSLRRAVGECWYNLKDTEKLALQVSKYKQRNGWTHRDLLRLSHPDTWDNDRRALYAWVTHPDRLAEDGTIEISPRNSGGAKRESGLGIIPDRHALSRHIVAGTQLMKASAEQAAALIREYDLPREVVPTELLNDVEIWRALLERMPMTAMIRNLGKMTSIGLLKPLSAEVAKVVERLGDKDAIQMARVHPFAILVAMKIYARGHGDKGGLTWEPVHQIVDALDRAFYLAFQNIVPTGKRTMLALDVSASMTSAYICNSPLSVAEAAAALCLITAATEKHWGVMGFDHGIRPLDVSPAMRLDTVLKNTSHINGGGTDCSLPMVYAKEMKLEIDAFIVITDNETHSGRIHPSQALAQYRNATGIPAKLAVVAMTATQFTIADPADAGMLDFVGFDTAAPAILADFIRA